MDAAERTPLRPGRRVCWLRLVDEATGAVLLSRVFDRAHWSEVGGPPVQDALRQAFARWGRPEGLRVDNGVPWVSPSGMPTDLELWLAGLGVALHRNPPRRPQANGKVERSQRTARQWAEPASCDTPEQLQRRLDEEDRVQREAYPLPQGQSRLEAHPALRHSGRGYAPGAWEAVCWDLPAALARLASWRGERKVDRAGAVSLYDRGHRVGTAWAGQRVGVRFCPEVREWVFESGGRELGRAAATQVTAERICLLQLSGRPGRSAGRTQARRARRQGGGQEAAER
jgi:hypothetical protein